MNTITKQLGCQTRHQENKTEWKTCLLAEGEGVTRGVHRTSHTDNTSHYTNLREYFPFNFPFQFWSHKKKNLGHKVQTHMWQIVLWQQFSCAIRGRGLRNKSQKEKISGTIWKRKKEGVKRSWCRVWKHQQLFCHSWHTAPLLSIQIRTNFSLRTFWYKLDARKNHLTSTIHTKKQVFSCLKT